MDTAPPSSGKIAVTCRRGLELPTIFNVEVKSVFRHWILLVVEYGAVIHDRLGHTVGQSLGVFYADDGLLGYWHPEWMQGALNILIQLLRKTGLANNVAK